MDWIDIRLRRPTEEEAKNGRNFFLLRDGSVIRYSDTGLSAVVAWMPISEFVPLPDPPEGYRYADPDVENFRECMKYWHEEYEQWLTLPKSLWPEMEILCVPIKPPDPPEGHELLTDYDAEWHPDTMHWVDGRGEWQHSGLHHRREYIQGKFFAVPIKSPEPQYRPFASAEEFKPYRDRWWRRKGETMIRPPVAYDFNGSQTSWAYLLDEYEFDDGTPFGVPVD